MANAASFERDLKDFVANVRTRMLSLHIMLANMLHDSIVHGSELTAAPGQPIDTGFLKGSWQLKHLEPLLSQTATDCVYSGPIEDGISYTTGKPLTLRSKTGGFHSVKLTRAGFYRLQEHALQRMRSTW